jgi:leader peptidase (prepilin peptidase) / N-methyltransferase
MWIWAGALLGLIAGSFIALVTWRWPQGQAVTGRSRCDHCGGQLGAAELVPLLSFLWQRGRCRHCAAAIAPRHLLIELACAAVGAALLWRYPGVGGLAAAVCGWWLVALIVLDVEHFWLPDALTLPFIPLALLAGLAFPTPPLGERVLAAGLGFAVLWALRFSYRITRGRDGMGGGDPKLLAGLGALLGVIVLPFLLTGASALGLGLALWDRYRGRAVSAATRLPLGALLAGVALILLWIGPNWWEMLR